MTKEKDNFWKGKKIICSKCKAINMEYWYKLYKKCGNCGNKLK